MHDRPSVETLLARLMPPALSVEGQHGIEAMIDDLAAAKQAPARQWPLVIGGIAAATAAALLVFQLLRHEPLIENRSAIADAPAEFTLMSESDRVENMVDEGLSNSPDGSAMRTLRLRVVEESRLLDETTGIVMNISQPREEILLMPVSTF